MMRIPSRANTTPRAMGTALFEDFDVDAVFEDADATTRPVVVGTGDVEDDDRSVYLENDVSTMKVSKTNNAH